MSDLDRKTTDPLPQSRSLTRLKRSRTLQLSGLMATVGFSMAACGSPAPSVPAPSTVETAYTSLDECKAANDVPDAQCDAAYAQAEQQARETGPRYATREECEGQWGPDQCRQNTSNGGSFFGPLVTGFVIGQLLGGGRGGFYGGGPIYRDRDNNYTTGSGGYLGRDYRTGRPVVNRETDIARPAPARVQSRTATVSRGGFGGGGRGYGG